MEDVAMSTSQFFSKTVDVTASEEASSPSPTLPQPQMTKSMVYDMSERQQMKMVEEQLRQEYNILLTQHQKIEQELGLMSNQIQEQKGSNIKCTGPVDKSGRSTLQSTQIQPPPLLLNLGMMSKRRLLQLFNGFLSYYASPTTQLETAEEQKQLSKSCVPVMKIKSCQAVKPNKFLVEFETSMKFSNICVAMISQDLPIIPQLEEQAALNAHLKLAGGLKVGMKNAQMPRGSFTASQLPPASLAAGNPNAMTVSGPVKPVGPQMTYWEFTCYSVSKRDQWVSMISRAMRAPPRIPDLDDQFAAKKEEEQNVRFKLERFKQMEIELKQLREQKRIEKVEQRRRMEEERRQKMRQEKKEQEERLAQEEAKRLQQERERTENMEKEAEMQRLAQLDEAERQRVELLLAQRREEALRKKLRKELLRSQGKYDAIDTQWMYKYIQALEVCCVGRRDPDDPMSRMPESMERSVAFAAKKQLFEVIGSFSRHVNAIAAELIEEMTIHENARVFPVIEQSRFEEYFSAHADIPKEKFRVYYKDNIAFKFAFADDEVNAAVGFLSQEFKAMEAVNRAIMEELMSDEAVVDEKGSTLMFSIRCALCVWIEMSGVVGIAMAMPCVDSRSYTSSTLMKGCFSLEKPLRYFNSMRESEKQHDKSMKKLVERMKLQPHEIYTASGMVEVSMSCSTQLHRLKNSEYEDLAICETPDNVRGYAPQFLEMAFIMKCAYILPVIERKYGLFEADINGNNTDRTRGGGASNAIEKRIRPELLKKSNRPLNCDAGVFFDIVESEKRDVNQVEEMLANEVIPKLIAKLDGLEVVPLDSAEVTKAFHEEGVNMRYLGKVLQMTKMAHVRRMCATEMVARVCKRVLRSNILVSYLQGGSEQQSSSSSGGGGGGDQVNKQNDWREKNVEMMRYFIEMKQALIRNQAESIRVNLADFLNLLLGEGDETSYFWSTIIQKHCATYFYSTVDRKDLLKGYLLQAVLFHCRIHWEAKGIQLISSSFLSTARPILDSQVIGFCCSIESFNIGELPYDIVMQRQSEIDSQSNSDEGASQLQRINEQLSLLACFQNPEKVPRYFNQALLYQEVRLLSQQSNILRSLNKIEAAVSASKLGLGIAAHGHISTVPILTSLVKVLLQANQMNEAVKYFQQAVELILINFGQSHPYFADFYQELGEYYAKFNLSQEAIGLYQKGISVLSSYLGEFHPRMAEAYLHLGLLESELHKREEAESSFEIARRIYVQRDETNTIPFATISYHLASLFYLNDQFEKSLEHISISVAIFENSRLKYMKELIDSYIVLANSQAALKKYDLCLGTTNWVWNIIEEADKRQQEDFQKVNLNSIAESKNQSKQIDLTPVREEILLIIMQVFVSNLQVEKVQMLLLLTHTIDEYEEQMNVKKQLESSILPMNIPDQESKGVRNKRKVDEMKGNIRRHGSLEIFAEETINVLTRNIEFMYSIHLFDNYGEGLAQITQQNLMMAIRNYESIQRFLGFVLLSKLLRWKRELKRE